MQPSRTLYQRGGLLLLELVQVALVLVQGILIFHIRVLRQHTRTCSCSEGQTAQASHPGSQQLHTAKQKGLACSQLVS